MTMLVGKQAPNFKSKCVIKNNIQDFELNSCRGKYILLFFYPLDFTFVCPTEIHAFQHRLDQFTDKNCIVLGCSVDSHYSHMAWLNTPKSQGGIKGIEYTLISDIGGKIAKHYEVLTEDGVALRGLFIIDKKGIIRHQLVNDLGIGRSIDEALRILDALDYIEKNNGEVCPANWSQGENGIKTNIQNVAKHLINNT